MAGDAVRPLYVAGGCFCCSAVVTLGILLFLSIDILQATEMAVVYDSIYLQIDQSQIYNAGLHFIGPGRSFMRYPKEQQDVKFPSEDGSYTMLTCRSRDGLKVDLEIGFQYALAEDVQSLAELYFLWGPPPGCFDAFKSISRSALRDVAARYDAYDFFANRSLIAEEMSIELGPQLETLGGNLDTFQLLGVTIDRQLDAAIQETEVVKQENLRAFFQMQDQEVVAAARVDRVTEEAEVIMNQKGALAKQRENVIGLERMTLEATMAAELNAFVDLMKQTGMKGRALLNYIWTHGVQDHESHENTVLNVASPSDVRCFASPASCSMGPLELQTQYSCKMGSSCTVKVKGSSLSKLDAVRIAKSDCATASDADQIPAGLGGQKLPTDSKPTDQKGFELGTPTEAGAFRLCYCAWSAQVLGCDDDAVLVDAGTLTVTPAAVAPDDGLGYGYGYI
jgi:hypothetical protein